MRNRTRGLQACSEVSHPTAPPRAPIISGNLSIYLGCSIRKIPYAKKKFITMINTAYLFQRIIVNSRYNFRAQRRIYPVLIRISILHRGTTRSVHSIRFTTSLCHVFIIVEMATSHVLLQRPTQTMSLDMILQYNNNNKKQQQQRRRQQQQQQRRRRRQQQQHYPALHTSGTRVIEFFPWELPKNKPYSSGR